MTDDIVTFLRARLDEDQAAAEAATPGPWRFGDWSADFGTIEQTRTVIERSPDYGSFPAVRSRDIEADLVLHLDDGWDDEDTEQNAAHILRHDPARVLADIAAKRAIVEAYAAWRAEEAKAHADYQEWALGYPVGPTPERSVRESLGPGLTYALRQLARPYVEHPEYQQEWNA